LSAASDRGKSNCDCKEDLQMPSWAASGCRYESVSSHTGLQYCSQQLNRLLYQVCAFYQIEGTVSVSSHTSLQYCSQQLNRLLYQV
jgi:hypothetical protein